MLENGTSEINEARLPASGVNCTRRKSLLGNRRASETTLKASCLAARFLVSIASESSLPSRARSLIAPTVEAAHKHPVDLLSFVVSGAEYFREVVYVMETKACIAAEKSAAKRRREENGRDAGGAERVRSREFSEELAQTARLIWEP